MLFKLESDVQQFPLRLKDSTLKEGPLHGQGNHSEELKMSLKLTRFTRLLTARVSHEHWETLSQGRKLRSKETLRIVNPRPATWKKQKSANTRPASYLEGTESSQSQTSYLEGAEISQLLGKGWPAKSLGKETFEPLELPAGCAVFPSCQSCWGWAMVVHLSLHHFYSCEWLPTPIPLSNPNKAHWLPMLDFVVIYTKEIYIYIYCFPRKSFVT